MTYDQLLTEIRRVNCDALMGTGKFSKEELLADRICAILNAKDRPRLLQIEAEPVDDKRAARP